ncbi:hypothetical protein QVD17_03741 [Tagetes erecta]|uniref:Uncharacterized protein n=1 Tax=Tagetes erecta TaxID=13708 RepID=A0AAD8PA68_TARER|nr:hypothetical protein QVD17_03741 [Tagetes erecta]
MVADLCSGCRSFHVYDQLLFWPSKALDERFYPHLKCVSRNNIGLIAVAILWHIHLDCLYASKQRQILTLSFSQLAEASFIYLPSSIEASSEKIFFFFFFIWFRDFIR